MPQPAAEARFRALLEQYSAPVAALDDSQASPKSVSRPPTSVAVRKGNRCEAGGVHEEARDVARRINASDQQRRSRKQPKKVEMLFARLKRVLRLDRLRLRGPFSAVVG